ncbi:MAG: ester cyclase [Chloroflexota bacterium]
MSVEQNIITMRRVIEEGFNKGNLKALDDCFAPTYKEHQFDLAKNPSLEGFKSAIQYLRHSFSDFSLTIEDMSPDQDKVWIRMTARGKNTTEFMGRPPTGRSFAFTVIDVCRFENGKIVEHWGVPDRFHMLLQLGFLQQPQPN